MKSFKLITSGINRLFNNNHKAIFRNFNYCRFSISTSSFNYNPIEIIMENEISKISKDKSVTLDQLKETQNLILNSLNDPIYNSNSNIVNSVSNYQKLFNKLVKTINETQSIELKSMNILVNLALF